MVDGTLLVVQWLSLGSPISVGAILYIILFVVILWGLAALISATSQLVTTLGAETFGSIIQLVFMFLMLSFISNLLGTVGKRRKS